MHRLIELQQQIQSRSAVVGVVGLGYVGIALAASLAKAGFDVRGVDIESKKVAALEEGRSPLEGNEPGLAELLAEVRRSRKLTVSTEHRTLAEADVILLAVETSVGDDRRADYTVLREACATTGKIMKRGALVIVESTVGPGATGTIVRAALEDATSTKEGDGFFLGCSPERITPGKLLVNVRTLPRICGAFTPETARVMAAFYGAIVEAAIEETDCVTAELVKTAENAYRDVKIAFANQLALVCEHTGADFRQVQRLVDGSGPLVGMLSAGGGVGGHCIPKASWLMLDAVPEDARASFESFLGAARAVNDAMPLHVARLVVDALADAGHSLAGSKIAVLGYAYREGSGDTRNTPSEVLVTHLRERGAEVMVHDPWVSAHTGDVYARVRGAHATVVMVAHAEYKLLDLAQLKQAMIASVLVDARGVIDPAAAQSAGFTRFRAVGAGALRSSSST